MLWTAGANEIELALLRDWRCLTTWSTSLRPRPLNDNTVELVRQRFRIRVPYSPTLTRRRRGDMNWLTHIARNATFSGIAIIETPRSGGLRMTMIAIGTTRQLNMGQTLGEDARHCARVQNTHEFCYGEEPINGAYGEESYVALLGTLPSRDPHCRNRVAVRY